LTKSIIAISLIALLGLFVAIMGRERILTLVFGPLEISSLDFKNLILGPKPNQFLVCPAEYCSAEPHLLSPTFPVSAEDLRHHWMTLIKTQPRIEPGHSGDKVMQYDFIQRSSLISYPDSITVKFIAENDNSSRIAIYSRSHYGKSDFGVNESRIKNWLTALSVAVTISRPGT